MSIFLCTKQPLERLIYPMYVRPFVVRTSVIKVSFLGVYRSEEHLCFFDQWERKCYSIYELIDHKCQRHPNFFLQMYNILLQYTCISTYIFSNIISIMQNSIIQKTNHILYNREFLLISNSLKNWSNLSLPLGLELASFNLNLVCGINSTRLLIPT